MARLGKGENRMSQAVRAGAALLLLCLSTGCFTLFAKGQGGAESRSHRAPPDPAEVAVPEGYEVDAIAAGFTFPIAVTFDAQQRPVVLEAGYSYGEVFLPPKLIRLEKDGTRTTLVEGGPGGPWTGVFFRDGFFYVADGGESGPGRILKISPEGEITELVTGLPTLGDHHTNGPAIGEDGWLYFATGTATNSGIVGPDNFQFGWLKRYPDFHDVPCEDVTLTGFSAQSEDPLSPDNGPVKTGPYLPFKRAASVGEVIKGRVPCSGAIMRTRLEGGPVELVAWGFRNPFGLALDPEGQLFATENGYDIRGSRPVFGASDNLWRVEAGRWYGWPEYSAGIPITSPGFAPPGKDKPAQLLQSREQQVPAPAAILGVHSSSNGFDFSRSDSFGHRGEAFIAQFGDMTPGTGKLFNPVGFRVVRVQLDGGIVRTFAANRKGSGPASALKTGGLERPTAARFTPSGDALYVVDFGILAMEGNAPKPVEKTGVLWRIRKGAK